MNYEERRDTVFFEYFLYFLNFKVYTCVIYFKKCIFIFFVFDIFNVYIYCFICYIIYIVLLWIWLLFTYVIWKLRGGIKSREGGNMILYRFWWGRVYGYVVNTGVMWICVCYKL